MEWSEVKMRAIVGERAHEPTQRAVEHYYLYSDTYGAPPPASMEPGVDPDHYQDNFEELITAQILLWQQRHAKAYADMCYARTMMETNPDWANDLVKAQQRQAVAYKMLILLRFAEHLEP